MEMPHLLDIQTRAFEALLQLDAASHDREDIGLERVFKDLFPITDVHENFSLEFVRYTLGEPKYTVEECIERDMTYSAPLKATLQLVINEEVNGVKRPRNIIEKEVYLGELPLLTPLGTFVINGAERVIVSQLHRSPGVVFERVHPPERTAPDLVAHHPVPRIVGRVHGRHPRRRVRPHRQEEEVPGHGAPARVRLRVELRHPAPLLRRPRSRPDEEAREPHRLREVLGAIIAEDIELAGEATAEDAPKARTKKLRPSASAPRTSARQGRRRADGRGVQPPPPPGHQDRQGLRVVHDDRSARRAGRDRAPGAPGAPHARARRRRAADGEVIADAGQNLTDTLIKKIRKADINKVQVFVAIGRAECTLIKNTLAKDPTARYQEGGAGSLSRSTGCSVRAMRRIRTAKQALERLFFSPKRYDLGRVGRYKINQRLGLNTPAILTVLTKEDFVEIIRYLVELHEGRGTRRRHRSPGQPPHPLGR